MPVLMDVLGAIVIGGIVLILLITFNFQITESAERQMYERFMTEHIEEATKQLNYVVGMAGIGIEDPTLAVHTADEDLFVFKSMWDHLHYQLGDVSTDPFPQYVSIKVYDSENALSPVSEQFGKVLEIRNDQFATDPASQSLIEPLGFIFWVDDLRFRYYDINDAQTSTPADVRAVELLLSFRRDPPRLGGRDLTNRVQMKCYLMNPYMNDK
ncbi:MAG: hypothetical protein R6T89_05170 [Candidatus Syntrophosphaera sp.]